MWVHRFGCREYRGPRVDLRVQRAVVPQRAALHPFPHEVEERPRLARAREVAHLPGFGVLGLGFRVQGAGCRVQGAGFRM